MQAWSQSQSEQLRRISPGVSKHSKQGNQPWSRHAVQSHRDARSESSDSEPPSENAENAYPPTERAVGSIDSNMRDVPHVV